MDELLQIPGLRRDGCSTGMVRRLRAGELGSDEAGRVREHLKTCTHCAQLLAELDADAAEFARQVPFDHFVSKTTALRESLSSQERRQRRRIVAGATAALAAGLVVVIVAGPLKRSFSTPTPEHTRPKGGGMIELYVGGEGPQTRLAKDGEVLAAGERLRVGYQAADHRYLAVISVDAAGEVTPLYPEAGESLRAETRPGVHLLPESVEFTSPGFERVIAVFSDRPVNVESLATSAKHAFVKAGTVENMGALEVAGEQSSKLVRKK